MPVARRSKVRQSSRRVPWICAGASGCAAATVSHTSAKFHSRVIRSTPRRRTRLSPVASDAWNGANQRARLPLFLPGAANGWHGDQCAEMAILQPTDAADGIQRSEIDLAVDADALAEVKLHHFPHDELGVRTTELL